MFVFSVDKYTYVRALAKTVCSLKSSIIEISENVHPTGNGVRSVYGGSGGYQKTRFRRGVCVMFKNAFTRYVTNERQGGPET